MPPFDTKQLGNYHIPTVDPKLLDRTYRFTMPPLDIPSVNPNSFDNSGYYDAYSESFVDYRIIVKSV